MNIFKRIPGWSCASLILAVVLLGLGDSRAQSSPGFFSSQGVVGIGLVDYGHHAVTASQKDFIAQHYDLVASGDPSLDFAFYRNINPQLAMFSYFNSILLALDQPMPADERAFLHDGAVPPAQHAPANRIGKIFEGNYYYVMDPSSPQWQDHARIQIGALLSTGFDGVLIDDVFAHLMHEGHFNVGEPLEIGTPTNHSSFSTVPAWYDPQGSHDGWLAFLGYLDQQLGAQVVYNGINDLAENAAPIAAALHPSGYLNASDGAAQEGFVYNGKWSSDPAAGLLGDEFWEATVAVLMSTPPGKRHSVVCYGDANYWRGRAYSLASYLIGYDPTQSSTFYYAPDEFTLTWLPEWLLDLGAPTESYPTLGQYLNSNYQVYMRGFENGVVIVNPYGAATGSIPLGGTYFEVGQALPIDVVSSGGRIATALGNTNGLSFTPVTSVQLQPYSAVLLMSGSSGASVPAISEFGRTFLALILGGIALRLQNARGRCAAGSQAT